MNEKTEKLAKELKLKKLEIKTVKNWIDEKTTYVAEEHRDYNSQIHKEMQEIAINIQASKILKGK